jgi:hypothetical protein
MQLAKDPLGTEAVFARNNPRRFLAEYSQDVVIDKIQKNITQILPPTA